MYYTFKIVEKSELSNLIIIGELIQADNLIVGCEYDYHGAKTDHTISTGKTYLIEIAAIPDKSKIELDNNYQITGSWIDFFGFKVYTLCATSINSITIESLAQ